MLYNIVFGILTFSGAKVVKLFDMSKFICIFLQISLNPCIY